MSIRRFGLALLFIAAPAAGADVAGLVDIGGGRRVYLECRGTGAPTVVLVGGYVASAGVWSIADKPGPTVFPGLAASVRVCAYDRPGTVTGETLGRSDPVPQPTSAGDAVADLHALLAAADEAGPYVLVGHSYGGVIVRLYAGTYPDDVAGMVLVDALSEFLEDAETPAEWAVQRTLVTGDIGAPPADYPDRERMDVDRSFAQIRAALPLRPMPLVVLSADRPWGPQLPAMVEAGLLPAGTPPDFGAVTDRAQRRAQETLAALVPGARHVTDTHSGHDIHNEQPRLVIDAVLDVVKAVRSGRTRLTPAS